MDKDSESLDLIAAAASLLDAREYDGGELFGYYSHETQSVWVVSDTAMVDLGRRIACGQKDGYSLWCQESDTDEVSDEMVSDAIMDAGDLAGVKSLRAAAAAAGDIATVAALDLIPRSRIRDILSGDL